MARRPLVTGNRPRDGLRPVARPRPGGLACLAYRTRRPCLGLRRIKQSAPAVPVQTRIASAMRCNFA
ncbi:hypothetical protein WS48_17245 [Burkholderia sp. RF7-non_BP1]|nr:hypothetical protein WS49_25995 [Burkholderia sp. RF7-non_BP4]KUY95707.1 hypothetical protein WS48_17245 [Burkholderia sp. RF7-non_BP1]